MGETIMAKERRFASMKEEMLKYQFKKLNTRNWAIKKLPDGDFNFPYLTSRRKAETKFLTDLHHWLGGKTDFIIIAIKNSPPNIEKEIK